MRIGAAMRRAFTVLVPAGGCASTCDADSRRASPVCRRGLVSPLRTAADYTVPVLASIGSYAQMTIAPRAVHAHVRLPLEEMDLVLRLDRDLDGRVSEGELWAARARVADYVTRHLHFSADGRALPIEIGQPQLRNDTGPAYLEIDADGQAASRIGSI